MPGKTDPVASLSQRPTYPGSKKYRAIDEGFTARYALQAQATNPHPPGTQEFIAWDFGWVVADANTAGTRFMPAISGPVPPLS